MNVSAPVHWTTYVQTFAVIASTIGTFVYVWFTYHIMKWAVGQGKAGIELSNLNIAELKRRRERLDGTAAAFVARTYVEFAVLASTVVDAPAERLAERLAQMEKHLVRLHAEWPRIASTDMDNQLLDAMESVLQVTGNLAQILEGAPYTESASRAEFVRTGILSVFQSIGTRWVEALKTQSDVLKTMKGGTTEVTHFYDH